MIYLVLCQRCGACCFTTAVIIRVGDRALLKPADLLCPHLYFSGVGATCAVHDEPWFDPTQGHASACRERQVAGDEATGAPCTLGLFVLSHPSLVQALRQAPRAQPAELEDRGRWAADDAAVT